MNRPKLLEPVLITVGFIIVAIWLGGAAPNADPLWFYPAFAERPDVICVYHYGRAVVLRPGAPGYEALVAALNAEIPQHAGFESSLRPMGGSLESYVARGYAVELVYPRPVLVHTRFYFPAMPRLLVALDGSYNYRSDRLLFRGAAQQWLPGGLVLESAAQIRAAADAAAAAPGAATELDPRCGVGPAQPPGAR